MMATERNKPSIIAKLMGLDEMAPKQQPIYRQPRVFSGNYLQKSASIGSREKRSSKARQKSSPVLKKGSKSTIVNSRNIGENGKLVKGFEETNDLFKSASPTNIVILRPNLGNLKHASKPSFLLDSHTTFAWEFKKQLLERSKMTKGFQEIQSTRRVRNLGEVPSMLDTESKQRSELGTGAVISSNVDCKYESVRKLPIVKKFNFSFNPNTKFKKMYRSDVKLSSRKRKNNVPTNSEDVEFSCSDAKTKQVSDQIACSDSAKEGCSSCSLDFAFELDSPCEDGFMSLNCIEIDDELPKSNGEAYQPSPNSVLEPSFKEDNSSSSENGENVITDLDGLWMKLQILKSESELEENLYKPEMVISSDRDATERSSFCICQSTKPVRCFGPKEREFSYLVDILDELGFHCGNVEASLERWHSADRMMNPLLFETLEKKYRKQESWDKADRQLLFDRINSGVSEILKPHVAFLSCSKPLRRKMSNMLRRDIVEEELCTLLLRQEKGVNAELSEKAVGREPWLELADEVNSMVKEIETCLFDELATELLSV